MIRNSQVIMLLGIVCFFNITVRASELVDKIIAVVNNEAVLQSDLKEFSSRFKKEGALDETLMLDETVDQLKASEKEQLQFLIREKLVESEIKRQNLSFTDDRLNQEIESLAKRNKMSTKDLEVYLRNQGYEIADYKKVLKARLERQSFFENEIVSKLRITDEDAYNEYKNKNPNYKPNVNEYKIAQIFFDPQNGGEKMALQRAEEVLKKISNGESFETLANKYTEEKKAAPGGLLGQFKSGDFNKDFERAIENLNPKETSLIIKTKQGYHILKLLEKKVTYDPLFLKYKEQIKASLIDKNFKRQLKNWFESKKQDAYIKIYE